MSKQIVYDIEKEKLEFPDDQHASTVNSNPEIKPWFSAWKEHPNHLYQG